MPDRPPLSRRALLGTSVTGLAAAVAAGGCDNGDEITPPGLSGSPSPTTPSPSPSVEKTLDERLVAEVSDALLVAVSVVAGNRKAPNLRPLLTPLLRAHRRHLQVLSPDGQHGAGDVGPADAAAALRAVRRSERDLHAHLVDAASRAESGALARLLASMAASVTQHLLVLPTEVTT